MVGSEDPAVALWRQWRAACAAADAANAAASRIEADLIARVGPPRVLCAVRRMEVPGGPAVEAPLYASSEADIDRAVARGLVPDEAADALKADLAARRARWAAACAASGLEAAAEREDEAARRADALAAALERTPAASPAGLAAKLAVAANLCEPAGGGRGEPPWALIVAALSDLDALMLAPPRA
ncbi:hypothetical protein [Azospirillum thermophilum]|uniref:Uncharacterized protein n=1 Tax=Azospirillum thermophilum TaxID=2202148 RepID=A0A2S2CNJ7_9PROT|nr:hypothetical protein [Azospirillum thermophilum]AWK85950.1 hypothetical protein DEW08_06475 [Azospirillum thermophilum]